MTAAVLEQAQPDVILTSFKSDDQFVQVLRSYGELTALLFIKDSHVVSADANQATFVIRPQKDFAANKGKSKLTGLRLLSELEGLAGDGASTISSNSRTTATDSEPRNAYDFMRRRQTENIDPALATWNASIRMDNFASLYNSPLCVRFVPSISHPHLTAAQLSAVGALIDHLIRMKAASDLDDQTAEDLEIRGIEVMTL
jgi:DNA mismatch repair protein MSH5